MKISELVKKLEHVRKHRGDIDVYTDRGTYNTPNLELLLYLMPGSNDAVLRIVGRFK